MVRDDLKQKIKDKTYDTGDKLPSENELCEIYNVGKATVRQALNMLVDAGYIYSVKRTGYYVAEPKNDQYIIKFDELSVTDEPISDIRVIFADIVGADQPASGREIFAAGSKALKVGRLFYYLEIPVGYEEKFLLYTKGFNIRDNDLFSGNSSDLINEYIMNYSVKRTLTLETVIAGEMPENYLGVSADFPILKARQAFLDRYDRPFGYCVDYYRSDLVKINASGLSV